MRIRWRNCGLASLVVVGASWLSLSESPEPRHGPYDTTIQDVRAWAALSDRIAGLLDREVVLAEVLTVQVQRGRVALNVVMHGDDLHEVVGLRDRLRQRWAAAELLDAEFLHHSSCCGTHGDVSSLLSLNLVLTPQDGSELPPPGKLRLNRYICDR